MHALHRPVGLLIVPIFGFANAGVSFAGVTPAVLMEPLSLGVAGGLVIGKLVGVFGAVFLLVRAGSLIAGLAGYLVLRFSHRRSIAPSVA